MSVDIHDITRKQVLETKMNFENIDISKLRPGTYLVNIHTIEGSITKKISIVR